MNIYTLHVEVLGKYAYKLTFEAPDLDHAKAEAIAYADRITGYQATSPDDFTVTEVEA